MRLHQGYFFDFSYSQSVQTELKKWTVIFFSCLQATTQWRKVQERLEDDERCSRLEKIDRLNIFQEYIRHLEKEEEEQKRIQKEQVRRQERKNRDAFRKMLEEHVTDGTITAKTRWRDYCSQIKDSQAYLAVASNTSGSTPKELFDDVIEELDKQVIFWYSAHIQVTIYSKYQWLLCVFVLSLLLYEDAFNDKNLRTLIDCTGLFLECNEPNIYI